MEGTVKRDRGVQLTNILTTIREVVQIALLAKYQTEMVGAVAQAAFD